uniref:SH2 domain-containing protein n=1 Tax=Steinernema glaseri TaxID=37863 RepID=A0A1I7YF18_9BILA
MDKGFPPPRLQKRGILPSVQSEEPAEDAVIFSLQEKRYWFLSRVHEAGVYLLLTERSTGDDYLETYLFLAH